MTAGRFLAGLAVIFGMALAAPLLELSSGVSGILGILIIGFGLLQAWRMAARDERLLMGPYEHTKEAGAGA